MNEEKESRSKPTLYMNSTNDDSRAYEMILEKKIDCHIEGPCSFETTPVVNWGFRQYVGYRQFERFLNDYAKN
ncbi:MAG: hypothetical protein KJ767_00365 [Nanoarchaeota archaeon]|nr:hypothetical protein [Nanoarchaeota archaeon]